MTLRENMKPSLIIQVLAALILLGGIITFKSGNSLPVYTDATAVDNLARDVSDYSSWYKKLSEYETGHKKITDVGRGLISLGLGASLGGLFLFSIPKTRFTGLWISLYWIFLWGIKLPLTNWYYSLRQSRGDYPYWGDSIVIGIIQDHIVSVIEFTALSLFLFLCLKRTTIAAHVKISRPDGCAEWLRIVLLSLWLFLLISLIFPSISDGSEMYVLPCTATIPIILLAMSSHKKDSHLPEDLEAP